MSGISLFTGSGFWSAEGHPLVIEYFAPVMERIRHEALDGFNRTGAGGFEIGGVLFGTVEGDIVHVNAHRPFDCEYAMGPAFLLSERDQERFANLLRLPETDPDLEGLQAVGWYHSHTRHGIYLSESDLDLHNHFFPEKNRIALVLRPDIFGSVRAGFFFREQHGAIRGDSSYCEFDITPPSRAPGLDFHTRRHEPELPLLPPMPGLGLPERQLRPESRGFPWVALLLAVVLALAAGGAALYYGLLVPHDTMALEVKDLGGSLRISWDRTSRPIMEARSGFLEIDDGGKKVEMAFDPGRLRDGSVAYTPQSAGVDIRLRVERAPGETREEYVRYVGPPRSSSAETMLVPNAASPPPPVETVAPATDLPPVAAGDPGGDAEPPQPERQKPVQQQAAEQSRVPPARERQDKAAADPAPAGRPESLRPSARFQPPPKTAGARATVLPLPPTVRPSSPQIEPATNAQVASSQVVGGVPGPPAPPVPPLEKPKPVYTGPSRGRLIWTGEVRSNLPITITGRHASYGSLSGELPGFPVRIQVHPADLSSRGLMVFTLDPAYRRTESAVEPPGPQNGWNPTVYTWNTKRARSVTVLEAPSPANSWKGIVLRGDIDWTPVIIIDWQKAQ